jgi:epoxyqueuosine reductase QueG
VVQVTPEDLRKHLEHIARTGGAILFGVGDLSEVEDESGEVRLAGLRTGIIFGYKLNDAVVEGITDHPTRTYQYHYRQVNILLDQIGLRMAGFLGEAGHRVFPVPSSQVVDWDRFAGHISHRAVARSAGLGWIGRNNLLVNPAYGSRVRYASVLTDLELPYDRPLEGDCGTCRACISACPGGAIVENPRQFDLAKCIETIDRIRKPANIGSRICGICVKACAGKRQG